MVFLETEPTVFGVSHDSAAFNCGELGSKVFPCFDREHFYAEKLVAVDEGGWSGGVGHGKNAVVLAQQVVRRKKAKRRKALFGPPPLLLGFYAAGGVGGVSSSSLSVPISRMRERSQKSAMVAAFWLAVSSGSTGRRRLLADPVVRCGGRRVRCGSRGRRRAGGGERGGVGEHAVVQALHGGDALLDGAILERSASVGPDGLVGGGLGVEDGLGLDVPLTDPTGVGGAVGLLERVRSRLRWLRRTRISLRGLTSKRQYTARQKNHPPDITLCGRHHPRLP